MYIRKVSQTNRATGKRYHTYRLVETYRNVEGKVRQRVLLNLGTHFDIPQSDWKLLADRIEEIMHGQLLLSTDSAIDCLEEAAQNIAKQVTHRTATLEETQLVSSLSSTSSSFAVISGKRLSEENAVDSTEADYCSVDINSLDYQQIRRVGAEHVGLEVVKQLGLDQLLSELKFNRKQINTALGSIIGRLVSPGSERSTHKYLQTQSALDELLGCDFQQLSLDHLYQISDKLLRHKETIESKLFEKEKDLFQLEEVITLYDLTNTYFEGKNLSNNKSTYGRSKEKRNDCPLVTLGLVLDASGFSKKSEIYEGNVSEPKTLSQMLKKLTGDIKPTIVMDAGIATEENILWLKSNGYYYIVVSRQQKFEEFQLEESLTIKHKKDYIVSAKLVKDKSSDEYKLYCHSALKAEKENAIRHKFCERYEQELQKLSEGLAKENGMKKYAKVLERLGRLKEKYKRVSYTYEVTVKTEDNKRKDQKNKKVIDIKWYREADRQKRAGVYCLRSNRKDLDEQTFWDIYIMLTDLEAAFRCLKSELGLRPIYHQKTARVDSHIFITVLAYHLLHTIKLRLKQKDIHESWDTIRDVLSTHSRITSTIKRQDGKTIHIRKSNLADPQQTKIYQTLAISSRPGKTEKSVF